VQRHSATCHGRQRGAARRCGTHLVKRHRVGQRVTPRQRATCGSGAPLGGAAPFSSAARRRATYYCPGDTPRSAAERRPVVRHPLGKAPPRLATRPPSATRHAQATRHAWQRIAVWRCGIYSATRHRDWRRSTAPATRHGRQRACGPATRHARRRGATRQRTPAERIARRVRIADLPRRQLSRPAIRLGLPAPEPMGSSPCFT
jgi:hypothetical protein